MIGFGYFKRMYDANIRASLHDVAPPERRATAVGMMNAIGSLAGLRHTVEEINDPSFQRILGTHDEKPIALDQPLKDLRSVSQMVGGDTDVRPNGMPQQSVRVVPEFCRQQRFHGWPNAVNNRTQIPRLVFRRPHKFFECGQNSPAPRVAKNHD